MTLYDPPANPKLSRQEFDYTALTRPTGFGEYMAGKFNQGWESSGLGTFARDPFGAGERFGPLPMGQDIETSKAMGFNVDLPRLTEEQWKKAGLARDGLTYEGGTLAHEQDRTAEFDRRRYRDSVIQRYQGNPLAYIAGFGAQVAGGGVSPENFIPFVGPEMRAAMVARLGMIGGHAAAGAVDATIGNALVDAYAMPSLARQGETITAGDFAMDLVVGAVAGTAFGGFGGWRERRRAAANAIRTPGVVPMADAIDAASEALDTGTPVDVGDYVRSDPNLLVRARKAAEGFSQPESLASVKRDYVRSVGEAGVRAGGERVFTASGASVDVQYQVRELADLVVSHNADLRVNTAFPAELQPRDRTRAASGAQIADIAANLQPEMLGRSATADAGAPIVGPDNVVESGNARMLALKQAYSLGLPGGERYRAYLESQGFDVAGMKEPVLVRSRVTELAPKDRARFTAEANQRQTGEMGSAERARGDAGMLDERSFGLLTTSDVHAPSNRAFVRAFVAKLPSAEASGMMTAEGHLSQAGGQRIRNAVLARAYGDADLVARLIEQPDSELGALGQALITTAPDWARMRAGIASGTVAPEVDGTAGLLEASRHVLRAKQAGDPLDLALTQGDLLKGGISASPDARAFMNAMLDRTGVARLKSKQALEDMLANYATEAAKHPPGQDLLGHLPPTPAEILHRTAGVPLEARVPTHQPDLTTTATPEPPEPSVVAAEKSYKVVPPDFSSEQATRIKEQGLDAESHAADQALIQQARKQGDLTAANEAELEAGEVAAKAHEDEATAYEAMQMCVGRFS